MDQYITSFKNNYGQYELDLHSLNPNHDKSLVQAILDLSTEELINFHSALYTATDLQEFINDPKATHAGEAMLQPFQKLLDLQAILIEPEIVKAFAKQFLNS